MIEDLYNVFEETKRKVKDRGVKLIDDEFPSEESRASRQMGGN